MADSTKLFRTSMNGFNKSDVTSYIEKMNFDFKKETEHLNVQLAEKDRLLKDSKEKVKEYTRNTAKSERLQELLDQAEQKIASLEKKLFESEELINAQNDALDSLCEENESLKNSSIKEDGAQEDGQIAEKARLYDEMSSKIGQILIDANRNADAILTDARRCADSIIEDANKRAGEAVYNASKRSEAIYAEAIRKTELFKSEYIALFEACSMQINSAFDALSSAVHESNDSLTAKASGVTSVFGKSDDEYNA